MRAKFRGKTLNISNQSSNKNEFCAEWNYYCIEIFQNAKKLYSDKEFWKEHKYYVCVTSPLGSHIVDGREYSTQSKCLQCAFDNIDLDLRELENMVSEKEQLIEEYGKEAIYDIKEAKDWLNKISY